MRIIDEPYLTPDGTLDFPFAYVFDGLTLTDGANLLNVAQQLQGDSAFILRRIVGVPTVLNTAANGGRFRYRNPSGTNTSGSPNPISFQPGIHFPNVWPVVPEKLYNLNDQISFDLWKILRQFNVCDSTPIYASQIAFMGVKRFAQGSTYPRQITPYKYRQVRYAYAFELTIDWAHFDTNGTVQPARRYYVQMDNFDFELERISISQPGSTGALTTPDFAIQLYDSNMHQFSNLPILQGFINAGRPTPATAPPYQATFPTPTQIYPSGGKITFDITSLLCVGSLPQSYELLFDGIWRYPL